MLFFFPFLASIPFYLPKVSYFHSTSNCPKMDIKIDTNDIISWKRVLLLFLPSQTFLILSQTSFAQSIKMDIIMDASDLISWERIALVSGGHCTQANIGS